MAEFCLECWNEMNETDELPGKYIFSDELELCEGCGEWKYVIVDKRHFPLIPMLKRILFKKG